MHIDSKDFPIVRVTVSPTASLEVVRHHFDEVRAILARRVPIGMVIDLCAVTVTSFSAEHRRLVASNLKDCFARYPGIIAAQAIIVNNPIARGVMTAILWLHDPPNPTAPFATVRDGEQWLRAQLRLGARQGAASDPGSSAP